MLGLCAARPLLGAARPALRAPARLPAYAYTRPTLLSRRPLSTSPTIRNDAKPPSIRDDATPADSKTETAAAVAASTTTPAPGRLARLLPAAMRAEPGSGASLRKMVALAAPEKRPLAAAVGLLFVSSAVSMSVPLTIGVLSVLECDVSELTRGT
jgi:hypothetical protein